MKQIFIDTWAWYALIDRNDRDHKLAKSTNKQLLQEGYQLVTTNFVLAEAITLIRYHLHHAAAVQLWQVIQATVADGVLEFIRVNELHEQAAWQIFQRYHDQTFSYTDCTSFAVMKNLQLSQVFTGDKHFAVMGFIVVP